MKNKKVFRVLVVVTIVIVVFVWIITAVAFQPNKDDEIKRDFVKYLEGKYGKSFVIKDYNPSTLNTGGYKQWSVLSYPSDQPSQVFEVWKDTMIDKSIHDNYDCVSSNQDKKARDECRGVDSSGKAHRPQYPTTWSENNSY